ncbi:competence protein ComEC [Litoreibacter halocynthiae]|uniref:Competence protein ComEC n=1 Tax=Litoreibacter halocynthiae TaxID=1242689 RepID=A0A4R7LSF9_9RHOB|nr:competence protein ComEC [Litoreibacter halocynthiae]
METRAANVRAEPKSPRISSVVFATFARQQSHLFPWVPVCLGAGIGLYFATSSEPTTWHLAGLAATLSALWLVAYGLGQHRASWVSVTLWVLTLVLAGTTVASLRAKAVAAPVLSYRYYGPIEGRIVSIDKSASEKMRLTLDHVRLSRVPPHRTPFRVRVSLHGDDIGITFAPGDTVLTTGHLGPPAGPVEPGGFDFQRHLWFQQLGALGYTRNPMLRLAPAGSAQGFSLWLYSFRLALSTAIKSRMSDEEGPFAAAIITGDRADLDPKLLDRLRASNLAHLLAISGLHMGLLTGAVFAVIRIGLSAVPQLALRLNLRKVAAVGALIAAVLYLGVSGANVATQRAFIMVTVMLLAICVERPALSLRAVAIAAFIVLIITPEALVGPGFQMSFAATTALVAVFAVIRDRGLFLILPKWLSGAAALLLSSFIAGAATAPYGAAHFNQVAQYGLLANLLSVPVMGLVVMPGALLAGCLAPLGLEGIGLWGMELGLAWILRVADLVSGLDGSTRAIVAPGPAVLPLVTLGGLMLCIWQGTGRLVGLVPVFVAFGLWHNVERPAVLISETGRLIGIVQNGERALNKPKGDGFSARVWLENDGDIADQAEAATRTGFSPNHIRTQVAGRKLVFNAANPEKIDIAEACATHDIVVLPRVETPLPEGCTGWTALDFSKGGAVAIYTTKAGLRYENSRSRQGNRLWVSHQRKRTQ